ncbi:beta-ketoacyl synthase N-terminal-like domain-containing protein [Lentzea albida]|uniref:Ketoacyl-synthetase C-terminal extension n=1 Tax=Lentzea albida TaxID=65499 RepID=A0A1H9C1P5_9PSEU|nr:beta-ketoacyl synthase N-terminal-like domain-containing protein [Lentzea albida]SEP95062.1 Ketoacyl-synthetase C-terminal extension [Lentzea albida]
MSAPSRATAVIGVAFELPRARTWTDLVDLLASGRDTIRPLPEQRAKVTGVDRGPADREAGWIDDIAGFDHRFFGMSRAEAEVTDPRQRRALELAVLAIGDAGYSPEELRGVRVAVHIAANGGPRPGLYDLLPPDVREKGPAWVGNLHANAAGRISYLLDLRGPALAIDTACSSFLVALHEARAKLATGEVDLALVGGFSLHLGAAPQRADDGHGLGVESPRDRCRPFDQSADGACYGEGGGFVLVKRLADAERDGDAVHCVLRGSAVNQDGGRGSGLTAPSPVAQTEVIRAAWNDAAVDPATIGYIEAHGTGTRIGDPIEIQGLADAFDGVRHPDGCVISSVKANFGHLSAMAGFAGLLSVLARFRARAFFPTAGFTAPNPLLPLDGAPIRVADRLSNWERGGTPRRAGVSSFGLSGTNAHLVVEEYVPRPREDAVGPRVLVLSAPSPELLREHVETTRRSVDPAAFDLGGAARVSTEGRVHFDHRCGWRVADGGELVARLESAVSDEFAAAEPAQVVFAFGGGGVDRSDVDGLATAHPGVRRLVREVGDHGVDSRTVLRLIGGHEVLADFGIHPDLVLGHGAGVGAARYARGEVDVRTALGVAADHRDAEPPDRQRLAQALAGLERPLVVDLGPGSPLSEALAEVLPADRIVAVDVGADPAARFEEILLALFLSGRNPRWRAVPDSRPRRRAHLPVAPLDRTPCWPGADEIRATPDDDDPDAVVLAVVREVLKEPGLILSDDFLDAGGNSINGVGVVIRLNERFGTDIDVLDLFDCSDLADLAALVRSRIPDVLAAEPAARGDGADHGPLSGQQTAIWAAAQLADDEAAYVVPGVLLFDGEVDAAVLTERVNALVARHPMLRAVVEDGADGPEQRVRPALAVPLATDRLDLRHVAREDLRAELRDRLTPLVCAPVDPYEGPAARFSLLRLDCSDHERAALLMSFHHLFFDGWSWRAVFAELAGAPVPPARTYLDHVDGQRATAASARGGTLRDFWSNYLHEAPAEVDLGPAVRNGGGTPGGSVTTTVPDAIREGLVRFAKDERVTPQMVLLSAWSALLWRLAGQRDLPIATPTAGRAPADEHVVGCYVTTVLTRVRVRPDRPLRELLTEVRASTLAALAHQELPTDEVLRAARRPAGSSGQISNVLFDYQSGVEPLRRLGADGPPVELLDVGPVGAKFALNLSCVDYDDRLDVRLEHADAGAAGLLDDFVALLGRITDPDATLLNLFGEHHQSPSPDVPDFRF